MRVLLFGALGDLAGWRERVVEPPVDSLFALRDLMTTTDTVLGAALAAPSVRAVVNKVMVRNDVRLSPGDEIAFLPPMSGG